MSHRSIFATAGITATVLHCYAMTQIRFLTTANHDGICARSTLGDRQQLVRGQDQFANPELIMPIVSSRISNSNNSSNSNLSRKLILDAIYSSHSHVYITEMLFMDLLFMVLRRFIFTRIPCMLLLNILGRTPRRSSLGPKISTRAYTKYG